ELPGDLVKIPTKVETFTSTISSFSSQVAELKNIQWKLPTEFLNLPSQVSSVQEKLQTLDSLPSLLHKVTDTLNRFSTMVDNASGATSMHVPSAGQTTASPAEGEKNTKDAGTNLKDELIDLLGKDVVTQEDGSDEVISNLKVSDLHSAEWRELMKWYDDSTGEEILEFKFSKSIASKAKASKSTTYMYKEVSTLKNPPQPFTVKSPVAIRNCIIGLASVDA
ncbi:hypothetical protein Tco_1373440, partial [Tanacetum coccineum]